ncbi:DNA-binding protein [Neobacillus sp. YX16]|uniref:DNA-binding protein n=1 Tax=Neobacillus sp. YX16 TaxID=3047874 RepID=UPI0024C3F145|nr:DNA-binding protein [Neobacillus sp. YX16]WHZ03392.1 DNA-binding protein [Neobacillus sp. YX16]
MIEIKMDDEHLKKIYLDEVQKRLDKFELQVLLLDSKQLCKLLSLSWPTVEKIFLSDPNFPRMRVGTKWVFNRREVQVYVDRWSVENRKRDLYL